MPLRTTTPLSSSLTRRGFTAGALALGVATPTLAQQQPATLSLWHNHPEWKDRVIAILNRFEAQNPGIKIDLQELPSSAFVPRINTALAAGEGPDIVALNAGPAARSAIDAGYLSDLTGKVSTDTLTPSARSASTYDGKVYAVPVLGSYTVGLYYNRDIFSKEGLTPPTTWEESHGSRQKAARKNITPMIGPAQDGTIPSFLYMLMASSILGPEGLDAVRKGKRKLTDPDVLKAAYFLRDIYGTFHTGALGTNYTEGKALFALGRGAMMEAGSADYAGFSTTNPKVNLGVVPFPAGPAGSLPP